jgi:site-specific DNA-methyltransferase (cytosine-N4-specific)
MAESAAADSIANPPEQKVAYETPHGVMYLSTAERFLSTNAAERYRGKVQLIFTSPPFPLNRKKKYGNLQGKQYVDWLASFAEPFREMLTPDGSVIELGNAWEPGTPVMSPLGCAPPAFLDAGQ